MIEYGVVAISNIIADKQEMIFINTLLNTYPEINSHEVSMIDRFLKSIFSTELSEEEEIVMNQMIVKVIKPYRVAQVTKLKA